MQTVTMGLTGASFFPGPSPSLIRVGGGGPWDGEFIGLGLLPPPQCPAVPFRTRAVHALEGSDVFPVPLKQARVEGESAVVSVCSNAPDAGFVGHPEVGI